MAYTLLKKIYDGVDGTNISEFRCDQYLLLMGMCESLGNTVVTYKDIQTEAERQSLFGKTTKAASAVRTICPILNKFGFVSAYQNTSFPANEFFTPAGKMFVKILSALQKSSQLPIHNPKLEQILSGVKTKAIQLGLMNMTHNQPNHKIWLVIYALRKLNYITKDIYYYILKTIQEECSVSEAIQKVKTEPSIAENEYLREDGQPMDSTNFGYLVANLKNAGLVIDSLDKEIIPTKDFNRFFDLLQETKYYIPSTYLSLIYECN